MLKTCKSSTKKKKRTNDISQNCKQIPCSVVKSESEKPNLPIETQHIDIMQKNLKHIKPTLCTLFESKKANHLLANVSSNLKW